MVEEVKILLIVQYMKKQVYTSVFDFLKSFLSSEAK